MALSKRFWLCIAVLLSGSGCTVNDVAIDLRGIERSSFPHDALACPPATCRAAADMETGLFDIPAEALGQIVREVVSAQARTEMVDSDPERARMVFVQRSWLFGFPDTIWVQILDLRAQSTLIMYSRSNLGYWDAGVNRRRVRDWLSAIGKATISPAASRPAGG